MLDILLSSIIKITKNQSTTEEQGFAFHSCSHLVDHKSTKIITQNKYITRNEI